MAVRGMNLDWRTYDVKCSECGVGLKRKLFHPTTGAAISAFFCNRACKGAWLVRISYFPKHKARLPCWM